MLACALAVELIVAAAVVIGPGRGWPASSAAGPASRAAPSLVVAGRAVHLIDRGGRDADRLLSRIAAEIGTAIAAVEAFWGAHWPRDITVVATGTQGQFRSEAGGGSAAQWAGIAAVTVADRVDVGRRAAVGQRIVFAPGAAAMSDAALRIVLTHELFHYATRAETAVDAPRWLSEGVADFVARPGAGLPEPPPVALPSDADLDAPGPRRALAYDTAWGFARFVADAYGTATLRAVYRAACGAKHADVSTAVRDVVGVDLAGLLTRWQQSSGGQPAPTPSGPPANLR
ncbi:hypothetical protein [Mycobacterium sp.]|uniref:hypothetical protein n=1 Tax=Mycobacterium sp. TaxID=1785 RepID=UPI0031D21E95